MTEAEIAEHNTEMYAQAMVRMSEDDDAARQIRVQAIRQGITFDFWYEQFLNRWKRQKSLAALEDEFAAHGTSIQRIARRIFELLKQSATD